MPPLTTIAAAQTGTPPQAPRQPLVVGGYGGQYECGKQAFGFSLKITKLSGSAIEGEASLPSRLVKMSARGEFPWSSVKVKGEYGAAAKSVVVSADAFMRTAGDRTLPDASAFALHPLPARAFSVAR